MKPATKLLGLAIMSIALPLLGQTSAPDAAASPRKVFILNFSDVNATQAPDAKDLNDFLPSLVEWRLRAESQILASRVPSVGCDSKRVSQSIQALGPSTEVYYTVKGLVTPHVETTSNSPSTANTTPLEMVLSYELDKVTQCFPEVLLRRSVPITAANALDTASVMADLIALKLEDQSGEASAIASRPSVNSDSDKDLNAHLDILLCRTTGAGQNANQSCTEKPDDAIPLIQQLVKRHPKDASELDWLGRAQEDAGHFLEASDSFNTALKLLANASPQQLWPVLERSADSNYQLNSYNPAAQQYKASLAALAQISAAEDGADVARVRFKLARTLRFNGDREGTLDMLLKGPRSGDEAKPYVTELRNLVSSMLPTELIWSDKRVNTVGGADVDPNVKALVYNREAEQDLDTLGNKSSYKLQMAKIDVELQKAEMLAVVVELPIRVNTLWLRSQWYIEQGQWEQAKVRIDQSVKLNNESDPLVRYRAAVFYYEWASLMTTDDSRAHELWQHAAIMAEPLLAENKSTTPLEILRYADSIYRNANHKIDQDDLTRKVYEAIVKRYPGDFAVRRGLIGLYTDFLKDPTHALESAKATYALPETRHDTSTLLDIAEVYVLNAEYDEAENVFQTLTTTLSDASSPRDLGYGAVSDFYQTWVALAKQNEVGALRAKDSWLVELSRYRNSNPGQKFVWIFDGAGDVLNKLLGLSEVDKEMLRQMIAAMTELTVALPKNSQ